MKFLIVEPSPLPILIPPGPNITFKVFNELEKGMFTNGIAINRRNDIFIVICRLSTDN